MTIEGYGNSCEMTNCISFLVIAYHILMNEQFKLYKMSAYKEM